MRRMHSFCFPSTREPASRDHSPTSSKSNKYMRSTVKSVDKDKTDLYSDGESCDKAYLEKKDSFKRKPRYMHALQRLHAVLRSSANRFLLVIHFVHMNMNDKCTSS